MEATTNRRQSHRYDTPETTFAIISPDHGTLGTVKDVSKGGLFFEYLAFDDANRVFEAGSKRAISIFRSGSNFFIEGISCEIIRDTPGSSEHSPEGSLPINGCAVKFGAIPQAETERLHSFFSHCKNGQKLN